MPDHKEQNIESNKVPAITEWVFNQGDDLKTDSRIVAKVFGKRHDDILRAIRNLECSTQFTNRNFALVNETITYTDKDGELRTKQTVRTSHYEMTYDGFMILVMGFTSKEAMAIKERYIEAFNAMKELITNNQYSLIEQLHKALLAEKVSAVMGSMAGKALNRRRQEKRRGCSKFCVKVNSTV